LAVEADIDLMLLDFNMPVMDGLTLLARLREEQGKDVFVHVSALERSGIEGLSEGQTVVVDVVEGRKGPEAARVRLI
jgi:cold shock CspA family protein